MKKRNLKKGFTIVELVIVIAVIAILSAVLIPTFSGVVENAKQTAAASDARALYTEYVADCSEKGLDIQEGELYIQIDTNKYVIYNNGQPADGDTSKDGIQYIAAAAPTSGKTVLSKSGTTFTVTTLQ